MSARQEKPLGQEAQVMLPHVTNRVQALYAGEFMSRHVYREMDYKNRDEMWEKTAQSYPPFADTIRNFRTSFKMIQLEREQQAAGIIFALNGYFGRVENPIIRDFLVDVLMSRTLDEAGQFGKSVVKIRRQVDMMAEELGLENGFGGDNVKDVTLEKAVEAVLTGELRFGQAEADQEESKKFEDTHIKFLGEAKINEKDSIQLYVDDETEKLSSEFDPESFKGHILTYGDSEIEMDVAPILALGWSIKRYVGVPKNDWGKLKTWYNRGIRFLEDPHDPIDVRIALFEGKEIAFPTRQLLENFGISKRRPTSSSKVNI